MMIAFIKETKLTDGSSVFDVMIETVKDHKVTMIGIPCTTEQSAGMLLACLGVTTNIEVVR